MKSMFIIIFFGVLYYPLYAQGNHIDEYIIVNKAKEHYSKGKEYSKKGDYYKANEEFKKAEELLTKSNGNKEKSNNYYAEKSKNSAKIEINSKIEDILVKAKNASSKGNDSDAIRCYLELLTSIPNNPDVYYNLGVEYLKKGDYLDATQEFMQVLKLNPKDADACYNLGVLYEVFMRDKDMAIVYYRKYLKIKSNAPDSNTIKKWIDSLENGI